MALSPMMSHYLEMKKEYSDCILFYRLGDFYEMFFDDAKTVSRELELTLTGKDCGLEERAPMCGVPFHAADSYINRLVARGYKVAIAEQVEDPKLAKGLVKREVIRVVTPGTNTNALALDEDKNNYLVGVFYSADMYALAMVDVTTGDFLCTKVETASQFMDEINKFQIAEIIANNAFLMAPLDLTYMRDKLGICIYTVGDGYFSPEASTDIIKKHFGVIDLSGLGLEDYSGCIPAIGAVLKYLYETQREGLDFINNITPYSSGRFMIIDSATRRNLELTETMREKNKKGSLLWVLDKTRTAMGARRLRDYIEQPLIDEDEIISRQDAIADMNAHLMDRDELREYLDPVYDLERLLARISYLSANPRDLIAFRNSLEMLPHIRTVLGAFSSPMMTKLCEEIDCLEDIYGEICRTIVDDPPVQVKEGGIIRDGYLEQIDRLRESKTKGKTWLADIEAREREETGIKSLKIRFNKVFGYYIEVTNTYKDMVPERYIRKQTLVNAERYITDELKELEETILGAEDKLFALEYDIFTDLRRNIAAQSSRIKSTASAISVIDAIASMAYVAEQNNYVRPSVNKKGIIDIKNGRHPVVEQVMQTGMFVPNDTYSDKGDNRVCIITGPNMAGKSTYMRQLALIVLMAQVGSFVPADIADICVCDRIFTRVGASDDLASGQSTFMVEMTEVATILRNATAASLIILDEIGRGTSTFDGLSIAWAVVEHIADKKKCGAKTFFSTHYHELTELEGKIDGVKNYCISVKEMGDDIIFLRKIVRGGADKSYGIQVAALAGVPQSVTKRAKEIVAQLVSADITSREKIAAMGKKDLETEISLSNQDTINLEELLDDSEKDVIERLRQLSPDTLTPLDALNLLYELKRELG